MKRISETWNWHEALDYQKKLNVSSDESHEEDSYDSDEEDHKWRVFPTTLNDDEEDNDGPVHKSDLSLLNQNQLSPDAEVKLNTLSGGISTKIKNTPRKLQLWNNWIILVWNIVLNSVRLK